MSRNASPLYHRVVVYALFLILLVPLAATLLYSLATSWSASVLPDGLTLKWFMTLWSDPRFLVAFGQSLLVCFGALILSVALVLPLMFVIHYYFPRLDALMNVLILLPFAVPPVVSSVGLLQLYASGPVPIVGTPWILIGCYFTIARAYTTYNPLRVFVGAGGLCALLGAMPIVRCLYFWAVGAGEGHVQK